MTTPHQKGGELMDFDTVLKRLMPNVDKKAERLVRFRDFAKSIVQGDFDENCRPKPLTEQERLVKAGGFVEECRAGVSEYAYAAFFEPHFRKWWPEHLSWLRSNAAGGSGQPKRKKPGAQTSAQKAGSMERQNEEPNGLVKLAVAQSRELIALRAELRRLQELLASMPSTQTQTGEEAAGKKAKGTTGIRKEKAKSAKISLVSQK